MPDSGSPTLDAAALEKAGGIAAARKRRRNLLALLGAVVAEFVSSREGLGHMIQASTVDLNVAMMFACVTILAAIGVISTQFINLVRRRVAFWERQIAPSIRT